MSDQLVTLSDAELNDCFCAEVLGWTRDNGNTFYWRRADGKVQIATPSFATSANEILPWLETENADGLIISRAKDEPWCCLFGFHLGISPTFARAACLALIRAKRARKVSAP